jgi:hypothetical protein
VRNGLALIVGRFRNNALALVNAIVAVLNSILYIRAFGISATSDALYYATSVVISFSLLSGFFTEQFLQYYNDFKHTDTEKASTFLAFNLAALTLFGVALFAGFQLMLPTILRLLYPTLAGTQQALIAGFLRIMGLELFLAGINGLLQGLAISYGRIREIYGAKIIASSITLLGQVLIVAAVLRPLDYPWMVVVSSATFALALILVSRQALRKAAGAVCRIDGAFLFSLRHYFFNSITMRFGHNLQGFLLPLITSAFWSGFQGNMATCYGYGSKFYAAIQSVIIGPSQMEVQHSISNDVSKGTYARVEKTIREYIRLYAPVTVIASAGVLVMLPALIRLINHSIDEQSIALIRISFIFLSVWLVVQCIESPYVITIIARKQSAIFISTNAIKLAVIAIIILVFRRFYVSILMANIVSQIVSLAIYRARVQSILAVEQGRAGQ